MANNLLRKTGVIALAMAMASSMVPYHAFAAGDAAKGAPGETDGSVSPRPASKSNDISDSDTIDVNKKGSIHIYKYDTTAATAAGKYHEGDIKATGQEDTAVSSALSDFAIQGVEFTYLKVGDIETYSKTTATGSDIVVVYEIPTALQQILNSTGKLPAADAYDMSAAGGVATPCAKTGVLHYDSTQLSDALKDIIDSDNITAKNALESYLVNYNTQKTDDDDAAANDAAVTGAVTGKLVTNANGVAETQANSLPLGLYLIVETRVPEEVTETVNPWLVTLPFTNTSKQTTPDDHGHNSAVDTAHTDNGVASTDNNGGDYWKYDFYAYPKNQTGNPTLDKSVRNSYSIDPTKKNDIVSSAAAYDSALAGKLGASFEGLADSNIMLQTAMANATKPIVVFNATDGDHTADTDAAAYVKNRGGYTASPNNVAGGGADYSQDFQYGDVTTASEGDVLDYIVVTKLPHITSKATYLSKYTFTDVLGRGITYNNDPRIAFYDNKADADANNTAKAKLIWNYNETTGNFGKDYANVLVESVASGETKMTVQMTEAGLNVINAEENDASASSVNDVTKGLSDYYMVLYYTATVESNEQVTLGDEGNKNDVALVWSRTNNDFENSLQDRNYVYSYGIDLTKTFSKEGGNFEKVQFKLYNDTDAYYVVAAEDPNNKGTYYVTGKTTSKDQATTFTPNASTGKIFIKGLEGDKYNLTEVQTDDGYTLLKDEIVIDISSTQRDVKAAVAGTTGLTQENAKAIIENYGTGIINEDGQLVELEKSQGSTNTAGTFATDVAGDTNGKQEGTGISKAFEGSGETPNGRTIGKTDMFVGEIKNATATVDGKACTLLNSSTGDTNSANAEVKMSVLNEKNFKLPETGGAGLWLITILGILALAGGVAMNRKEKIAE